MIPLFLSRVGEAEDDVRCDSCHAEERVWRRSHQRRNVRHGRGLYKLLAVIADSYGFVVEQPAVVFVGRTTCAFRDTCATDPPVHLQRRSQQLSRSYNELKSQRYSETTYSV